MSNYLITMLSCKGHKVAVITDEIVIGDEFNTKRWMIAWKFIKIEC